MEIQLPQLVLNTLGLRTLGVVLGLSMHLAGRFHAEGAVAGDVMLDFGSITVGAEIMREFVVRNESEAPYDIKAVQSSCTCLRVISYAQAIPAKGEGRITVGYRSQRPGRANVEILVETDRAAQPLLSLRLTGEVAADSTSATSGRPTGMAGASLAEASVESPAMYVSANDVVTLGAKTMNVLLVDVREPRKFERSYIGGAVNYPIYALKTLAFLKHQDLVLLNEGHNDAGLAQEAILLAREGFKSVRVLRGGLRAWSQVGGKLRGNSSGAACMVTLSASDYYAAQDQGWLVVDIGRNTNAVLKDILPGSVKLPFEPDAKRSLVALGELLQSRPALKKMLISSALGEGYETIELAVKNSPQIPVFYLDGGTKGYLDFLTVNEAFQGRHVMTLAGKLDRSSVTGGSAGRGKPCGTCP